MSLVRGEPWFDDGNVVLLTDDGLVAFKLHRGVLARSSEVMETMFAMDAAADTERIEGCPVVRVYDDPEVLSDLLKAIYDAGLQFSDSSAADWFQLSAVLLLATKYEIARIRRQALRFLAHSWPYTLAGHDDMIERALRRDAVNGLSYPFVHPLHVLGLARAADAPLLIPAAMYFLSMYPVGDLVRADHPKLRTPHPHARPATLGANELADYARMFQHRLELMLEFTRRELPAAAPVAGCTHPQGAGGSGPCSHTLRQLASRLARSWVQRTSPLHFMAQAPLGLAGHPICTPCREAFCARIAAVRERTWQALPAVIGMPGWDVLLGDLEEDS